MITAGTATVEVLAAMAEVLVAAVITGAGMALAAVDPAAAMAAALPRSRAAHAAAEAVTEAAATVEMCTRAGNLCGIVHTAPRSHPIILLRGFPGARQGSSIRVERMQCDARRI